MTRPTALAEVVLAALAGCSGSSPQPPSPAARAVAEFAGAYPTEAPPSTGIRDYELVAAPSEVALIDGRTLSVWAYNGQVPGPTLRVRLGETLRVRFTNKLPEETTIHWHGVRVPNAMDGVPGVTQPPIAPGETFTYEFTPKDAGTFWYHPHVRASEQVERGLYGMLVVEDPAAPAFTQDVTWVVDDWRLDATGQIDPAFNTRHDLAMDGRWGGTVTVNGHTDEVLRVRPGERVRLRILDSANGRVFRPDFGAIHAEIIAVDGLYVREPVPATGFELAPGNRIDVELRVDRPAGEEIAMWDRFVASRPNRLATIVVAGDPVESPGGATPRGRVPVWRDGMSVPIAHSFHLNAEPGGPFGIAWTIDGMAFDHMASMPAAVELTRGQFHHLQFVNDSPRIHPMHMHGMFFRVLARDGVAVDEPFFRDTALVHPRETVDIGLVPTETGSWMMHCHILEHAESGMMTLIDVQDSTR